MMDRVSPQSPIVPATIEGAEPAVSIRHLNIEFPVLSADSKSLRSTAMHFISGGRLKPTVGMEVRSEALRDINIEARSGDRIALIGRNGAGKSTLLKVLAGVYHPTSGQATIIGRVSALLGGSMGLEGELSGWEAMDIGCLLLGLSRAEIRERRSEIAEFTELGGYLDMPVRTYSAGMRVRLAFAIATSVSPDILLIDEVIGAGDAHFVRKARQRMTDLLGGVQVVFLASHSSDILRAVCTRAILMDMGEIVCAGEVDEVLEIYNRNFTGAARLPRRKAADGPTERPIGSAAASGHEPAVAFDGEPATRWLSAESGPGVHGTAWLGTDYSGPVDVTGVTIRQWNGALLGNMVSEIVVQQSDDAFAADIRDVGRLFLPNSLDLKTFDLPPAVPAHGWRVIAASGTAGGPWGVSELAFLRERKPAPDTIHGRPISNAHEAQWDAGHAFDGKSDTMWVAQERGEDVAGRSWIGIDYGTSDPREIRRVLLQQWNGGARPNVVQALRIQASDDGFLKDIRDIAAIDVAPNARPQLLHLPASAPARFWRVLAASPTKGGHWGIIAVEFEAAPEPEFGTPDETEMFDVTPISSGHYHSNSPKQAFDGRADSCWLSAESGDAVGHTAFIGLDIGGGREAEIRHIVLQQATVGSVPEFVTGAVVQASDDNFVSDIRDVAELSLPRSIMRHGFTVPPSRPSRYWRLLAADHLSHPEARWAVANLEVFDGQQRRIAGAASSFSAA